MKATMRGAEAVMSALVQEGVDTLFGYPGGAIMPIYDALFDYRDQINHLLVRHEQGAIHAAQGYARATGKTGVVLATSGPGATNLITGLADAMIDSTPVVCITGQVASHLLGTDAFQETDVIGISMPVTKWNFQVTQAEEIAPALAKAFYLAQTGRPGPVLIDITKDAQFGSTEFNYPSQIKMRSYEPIPALPLSGLKQAAKLIDKAQKPLILAGQGIMLGKAENLLLQFAEHTGIPVAATLLGLGAFPTDHELYAGYLGMHGNYAPNMLTNSCDLLIAVGMRFDDRVTGDVNRYARQARVIHIDIDRAELNKNIRAEIPLHADAADALRWLCEHTTARSHMNWMNEFRKLEKTEHEEVIEQAIRPKGDQLQMAQVINRLSEVSNDQTIIVTDVGQHQMITSRYFKYKKPRTSITSGGLGTMGFALPAAIGAKTGRPDCEVIAVIGDGGFQMTIQELGTMLQYKTAVKIIILNNHFLGMVRQWQQLFFDRRYSFTEIVNPDFCAIAGAYGIPSRRINHQNELNDALEQLMKHNGSYLLEVEVKQEENVFPMIETGASVSEIRLK